MTKRNNNKLTVYRRHLRDGNEPCRVKKPTTLDKCECPLWAHGKLDGKFVRKSLDTRNPQQAYVLRDLMLEARNPDPTSPSGGPRVVPIKGSETLDYAAAQFEKANEGLGKSSQKLYKAAIGHFQVFARTRSVSLLHDVTPDHMHEYIKEYSQGRTRKTAMMRLTHLRVFFNWCCKTRHWIQHTPTEDRTLNRAASGTKARRATRVSFTPTEVTAILAAIDRLPEAERVKARALIMLLLFTGMRISDATFFERAYISPENLADYYVIKTRRKIDLAPELQRPVLDALAALPSSNVYFFQPDARGDYQEAREALREQRDDFAELMPGYGARIAEMTRIVKKVLTLAGINTGACHRFRDTFAMTFLINGGDIYTLSKLLGHSDVKITDGHYLKLIPGYSEKMSQRTRVLSYAFPDAA